MTSPSIEEVLRQELEQIKISRAARLGPSDSHRPEQQNLIGLAFSGGGIRSATFNLGILQGLAQLGLLGKFDYLSTVSGGGYIGSWLMAWMQHQRLGIGDVEKKLAPQRHSAERMGDPPEVRFLRNYSNYLTPRKGVLSADFWAFLASYLRNTLLNLAILLLLLLSLLLLPRSIVFVPHWLDRLDHWGYGLAWLLGRTPTEPGFAQYWALAVGMIFGLVAVVGMGLNLCWVNPPSNKKSCWIAKPWAVHIFIAVPLLVSASLLSYGLDQIYRYDLPPDAFRSWVILIGASAYFSPWLIACGVRSLARRTIWRHCETGPATSVILLGASVTSVIAGLLLLPYAEIVNRHAAVYAQTISHQATVLQKITGLWTIATWGTPALAAIMLIAGALHIGLMGRQFPDAYREWWARLGGTLGFYAACWMLLFLTVAYVPIWLGYFVAHEYAMHHYRFTAGSALVWTASTAYGVLFGKSGMTTGPGPDASLRKKILGWAARLTPYIFILGLLILLSVVAAWIAAMLAGKPFELSEVAAYENRWIALSWIAFLAVAVILSSRVDINAFSTHLLYRNRLVRCYLGASVVDRREQPFTGFSSEDDVPLSALRISGAEANPQSVARPIPLLNASLNVTRGKELALQTRKARGFVFTPVYSGYARPGAGSMEWQPAYAETALAGKKKKGTEKGITLGTAVAISGAAASPNMGSYTTPALAFLMTLFDVRLGWWLANPSKNKWELGSPDVGFWCLLQELAGATNDSNDYVYLSDGGHFENLALYELVRRRCKLILACDASCDPGFAFGDLSNAIERCRADFGVEITRQTHYLVPQDGRVDGHFDFCKIQYTPGDDRDSGLLVYVKPALKKDDPEDLLRYAGVNQAFPHDSTADQWFDEDHFENYRYLGYVSALSAEKALRDAIGSVLG